jgi:hypothetical protein
LSSIACHSNASGLKDTGSTAIMVWVGIIDGPHDILDASVHDRSSTWGCLAVGRTGLKRDIERGALRPITSIIQSLDLSMRTAENSMSPSPNDDSIFHNDSTHPRIRFDYTPSRPC